MSPAVLPYMLTGVCVVVGAAWLVIVAAEMLTGGVGIGIWVRETDRRKHPPTGKAA